MLPCLESTLCKKGSQKKEEEGGGEERLRVKKENWGKREKSQKEMSYR